jgi:hypothetical protein
MRTLSRLAVAVLLIAGAVLVMYGLCLSPLGLTIPQARGGALVMFLGTAGAELVILALAGARGRL